MMEGDHAIIMDFGIARSTSRGGAAPARPATVAAGPGATGTAVLGVGADAEMTRIAETVVGEVIGTIEYMAPEQARGEHVDQRADVYAFGLIIYDLLTGKRRSERAVTAVGELQKRLAQPPPSIRTIVPDVPQPLDQLITKCTEPDAANRYPTTTELVAALDLLDDNGGLKPKKRVVRLPYAVAAAALLLTLSVGVWWYQRQFIPPPTHDPVSVVIADFVNSTGDSSFHGVLESTLQLALEGAGFITAFNRTVMGRAGVAAPETLDEAAARAIALKQGLGVVVSGSLEPQRSGYQLSLKAVEAVTGNVITTASETVSAKDQVVPAVTRLSVDIRTALGDETSESKQLFAMETMNVRSFEVVQLYARAMDALAKGRYQDARNYAQEAAKLDPEFGAAYGVMASASDSLGERTEAEKYIKQAVAHLDKVTEREQYRMRGLSFRLIGDQQKCVDEYSALVSRYSSDAAAHNNLAVCASHLRQLSKSLEEFEIALKLLPNSVRQRSNLALMLAYKGDFQRSERAAQEVHALNPSFPKGFTARAFALLGQDRVPEAIQAAEELSKVNPSDGTTALADTALYQGRLSEASSILQKGADEDIKAKSLDRAADKLAALAYTFLTQGQKKAAIAAGDRALTQSKGVKTRFLVGRIFALAGDEKRAREQATTLASGLYAEPKAYAKIVEANIAMASGKPDQAIAPLTEANKLLDTWIGRFDLGRAYLGTKQFLEADAEFARCFERRGEALALFLDEVPTYGYFPPVHYYRGRVRQEMGIASYADSYKTFVAIRGQANEDPLLKEARDRLR
jgi:tetratricopeptide (TPR) repeat protein